MTIKGQKIHLVAGILVLGIEPTRNSIFGLEDSE
jgi:hypothetical protein